MIYTLPTPPKGTRPNQSQFTSSNLGEYTHEIAASKFFPRMVFRSLDGDAHASIGRSLEAPGYPWVYSQDSFWRQYDADPSLRQFLAEWAAAGREIVVYAGTGGFTFQDPRPGGGARTQGANGGLSHIRSDAYVFKDNSFQRVSEAGPKVFTALGIFVGPRENAAVVSISIGTDGSNGAVSDASFVLAHELSTHVRTGRAHIWERGPISGSAGRPITAAFVQSEPWFQSEVDRSLAARRIVDYREGDRTVRFTPADPSQGVPAMIVVSLTATGQVISQENVGPGDPDYRERYGRAYALQRAEDLNSTAVMSTANFIGEKSHKPLISNRPEYQSISNGWRSTANNNEGGIATWIGPNKLLMVVDGIVQVFEGTVEFLRGVVEATGAVLGEVGEALSQVSFGQFGSVFGSNLSRLIQTDNEWQSLGVGSLAGTIGLNIGQEIDIRIGDGLDPRGNPIRGFDDFPQDLASAGLGAIGSYLFAEWVNEQGLGEFGGGLVNSQAGAIIGQIADNLDMGTHTISCKNGRLQKNKA